jgi:hypothetical protein
MKRYFLLPILILTSAFSLAAQSDAKLVLVKTNHHRVQRHRAHKAAKHHRPRRQRHHSI